MAHELLLLAVDVVVVDVLWTHTGSEELILASRGGAASPSSHSRAPAAPGSRAPGCSRPSGSPSRTRPRPPACTRPAPPRPSGPAGRGGPAEDKEGLGHVEAFTCFCRASKALTFVRSVIEKCPRPTAGQEVKDARATAPRLRQEQDKMSQNWPINFCFCAFCPKMLNISPSNF